MYVCRSRQWTMLDKFSSGGWNGSPTTWPGPHTSSLKWGDTLTYHWYFSLEILLPFCISYNTYIYLCIYIKVMSLLNCFIRQGQVDRARDIYDKYVLQLPTARAYIKVRKHIHTLNIYIHTYIYTSIHTITIQFLVVCELGGEKPRVSAFSRCLWTRAFRTPPSGFHSQIVLVITHVIHTIHTYVHTIHIYSTYIHTIHIYVIQYMQTNNTYIQYIYTCKTNNIYNTYVQYIHVYIQYNTYNVGAHWKAVVELRTVRRKV